ncbi:MAG TPA: hypothetical protein VJN43_03645 [Bryobacteraceae bacterium]|nr:hypothetical protein [Bryobacteraceae bacterium]
MKRRPIAVTIIAWVYIVVGTAGFAYHFREFEGRAVFAGDTLWVELVRLAAVAAGIFLLRGHNWARWLAVAWIAVHVVVSAFHSVPQLAVHAVFCAAIAYFLFRREAAEYFRAAARQP